MCGRYALYANSEQLTRRFGVPVPHPIVPRYNIAPSQPILALRYNPDTNAREWTHLIWGLVPAWAQDPSIGNRMINARAETLREKPAFRNAYRYRRCIVPVSGFYEWKKVGRTKQPYFVRAADNLPMGLAGLWEVWHSPDGSELHTCTIITTDANATIQPLHNRMAVVLPPEAYALWLSPDAKPSELDALLKPAPNDLLIAYPVSTRVNNPANDDPSLIEPITLTEEMRLF
ncbi:MAG: SOS response-associated peptidase [Fimbriimonadales bacterium]|nr:SOS response-associated peptidase [Fimbriimonadales bacterium]MDW8051032.1 SOS response-associated peptidase [Armatimonadota bacterium]